MRPTIDGKPLPCGVLTIKVRSKSKGGETMTRCHHEASHFGVPFNGLTIDMCDRHHAALRCPNRGTVLCLHPMHDHRPR